MDDLAVLPRPAAAEKVLHRFEFRGSGGEFFRIWIVNIALMLVTLGIYSAWAKVRTRRYFYGNTFVAGHSFDYHASPVRILIGRIIALLLLGAYNLAGRFSLFALIPAMIVLGFAIPWLIVASRRFNARNTSYRNVRFNFSGTYGGAFEAYIAWSVGAVLTLGGLMPLAHRARDYYFINNHSFGGKRFATKFSGWSIYKIYLLALLLLIGGVIGVSAMFLLLSPFVGAIAGSDAAFKVGGAASIAVLFIGWFVVRNYVRAASLALTLENTSIDNRDKLESEIEPGSLVWVWISNIFLILFTVGLFYPWARVRVARYMADHMGLLAASNLDEFTSESFATQSAIGEEIAGFFDYDIGL